MEGLPFFGKFIPGDGYRYSITPDGKLYSHVRGEPNRIFPDRRYVCIPLEGPRKPQSYTIAYLLARAYYGIEVAEEASPWLPAFKDVLVGNLRFHIPAEKLNKFKNILPNLK